MIRHQMIPAISLKWSLILLLIIPLTTQAQRFKSFSNDPTLTSSEMRTFAETVPKERQKEAETLLLYFDEFWNSSQMTESFQNNFIEMSNMMLRKNLRFFPHFKSYIEAFNAFINSDLSDHDRDWMRFIQYHIDHDISQFDKLMVNYTNIFNANILNTTPNVRWTAYGIVESMGMEEEPYISYKDVDLVGAASRDSVEVIGTSGKYFPASLRWAGTKGSIFWYRAGLSGQVKTVFGQYDVDMRQPKVRVENAKLYYPDFFSQPVAGVVEDKTGLESEEEKVTYPRFRSYDNSLLVKNIYKNVDYIGGFELRGASIRGYSDENQLAQLIINKNNKRVAHVYSLNYLFKEETVRANDAKTVIYIEDDSIFHPSANFYYNENSSQLLISRPKYGVGRSPFFDTYHKMDITAESVAWDVTTDKIEFKPLTGSTNQSSASFESQNFFNSSTMSRLQGVNDENPLYTIWNIFRSVDYQPVSYEMMVRAFNHPPEDVKALLIQFAADGFVEYDVNNNMISYRHKIAQYLNNDVGKKDYDNIVLESKNHYATLDLTNNELDVSGCEFFVLSDAQIVNVYPANEHVTVKKDRDMEFAGRIVAGLFDFVSHKCQFNYDQFTVQMDDIDSLIMYVEDKNGPQNLYGEYRLTKVMSPIEDLGGTLYIDMPKNKSGRIDNPKYPMFTSYEGGKVYYDHPFTFNRHYDRTKFFYLVDIFTITNLDNFDTDSIQFEGQLVSGGIFPDIRQPLKVRPDFSLGFIHETESNGLPMYGGKGQYFKTIDLSNRGLRGKGDIQYLTSLTHSDSLVFFLDATTGRANSHVVNEQLAGVEYPPANVEMAALNWRPYSDAMFVYTDKMPMNLFNEATLVGNSKLTPAGMYGTGTVNFKRADITSQLFEFKHHELLSDSADLRIYDLYQTDEFVFSTDNYNSHIDFKTRKGNFVSNGDASEVLFTRNQFKTNASAFEWKPIDEDILIFKWDDPYKDININATPALELIDMKSVGNELIATNHPRYNLQFTAVNAEFNFRTNVINAHGVRYVNCGDAAIIPDNGDITILEQAFIQPLQKARIVAGRENKYHQLYNCNVSIVHAADFKGSGDYDYIDENKEVQIIHFDTVWYYQKTQGDAKIPMEVDFKLSPHFGFDGRAELSSENEFLTFIGGVEFIHDCDTAQRARMRISDQINPNDILIEIDNRAKDVTDRKVVVAIASTNATGRIYTCFGAAKDQFNDSEYISANGFITFDHASQEFRAASIEKLRNPELPGNMISLSKTNCISIGSGTIDMGAKLGRVDFNTVGSIVNYMKADSADMSLTTSIDFFFNENAMKIMNKHIEESLELDFIDSWEDMEYELALKNMLTEEEYDKYAYEVSVNGQAQKLPEKLRVQFLFSNIGFKWDKIAKAFISQDKLPLIICGSKEVNKEIPGQIVIEKRGSRNRLYLFFEIENDFFFFQCENNSMYGMSSDEKFNDAISSVKVKKRMLPAGDGKPSFTYKLASRSQKAKFMKKFYQVPEPDEGKE